jgi:hypothetical protein
MDAVLLKCIKNNNKNILCVYVFEGEDEHLRVNMEGNTFS